MTIRRRTLLQAAAAAALLGIPRRSVAAALARYAPARNAADRPRPTPAQLRWQQDELALFVHFGVNTFTDREWGDGTENPALFNPSALDARQWARTAKAAGFRMLILTAKHHDGFCLWPTKTTRHSVVSSPWRGGQGDVVREFTDACRSEGWGGGLYLLPWDRNDPTYGDTPADNAVYREQLTELLTQYGRIDEVWFDGANGEGPNGKRQTYDWNATWGLVRQLQPQAVMFSDAGPDVRWIGNETGVAGTTNWSTVDPRIVGRPGMEGAEVMRSLTSGDRDGTVWRPGETDVSIRPGWFYHPAEDRAVRTAEQLVQLYFTSVGRNSKLLLNVPPDRRGLFADADVASLLGMRSALNALFADDLARGARRVVRRTGTTVTMEYTLRRSATVGLVDLRESIADGQRVAAYTLESWDGSAWRPIASGTTIGYSRLERVTPVETSRLRVVITDSVEPALPMTLRCFRGA